MSDTESRATVYTHQGAPAGKALLYRVQAINSVGPGPASAVEEVMTSATMLPSVPAMVTAMPNSDTEITVSWMAPDDMGAGAITGYMVQRGTMGTDGTMSWTDVDPAHMGTDMEYMDTGLMAETTYYYRVRAMNAEGYGEYSDGTAMATTEATPPKLGMPMITGTNPVGSGIVLVSWDAVAGATGYSLIATNLSDPSAPTRTAAVGADAESGQIQGLTIGDEYLIFVGVFNDDLEFELSDYVRVCGRVIAANRKAESSGPRQSAAAGGRSRTE